MTRAGCPACRHPERRLLDALLRGGFAPRAIVGRVGAVSRRQLARHRDECLTSEEKGERE